MTNTHTENSSLSPAWPDDNPWLVLRLDWAHVEAHCWMIAPEDARAAWEAIPPIFRPSTPEAFARGMLLNFAEQAGSASAPLAGLHAFGFSGAASGSCAELGLAEICRGKLPPLNFTSQDAARILGAAISESFPHAAAFGPLRANEDGPSSLPRLLGYWTAKIEHARAMVDAQKMSDNLRPAVKAKPRSL